MKFWENIMFFALKETLFWQRYKKDLINASDDFQF
jgi:hypothetical protein